MTGLKVVFTIAGLRSENGGPSRSIPQLSSALARDGVQAEIVTLDSAKCQTPLLFPPPDLVHTTVVTCTSLLQQRLRWTAEFSTVLRRRCLATGARILHDNGLWLPMNRIAFRVGRELGLRRIVSPRGMLTNSALNHKGWKKRLAWALYQRGDLKAAEVLHATSKQEAQGFRAVGLKQPIAVVPNGVELPALECTSPPPNSQGAGRIILYLGRIHPIKGLADLVRAWAKVRPSGWRVAIAGSGDGEHHRMLEAEIRELGLSGEFSFLGTIDGEAKWKLYRQAALFVLPSHSENFGIAVAEALASGLPVITTKGTPWEELVTHRCGWWTAIGPEALAQAIREAATLTDEQRSEMGLRGRRLVQARYAWPFIAQEMRAVYEWVLRTGPKPSCMIEN